MDFIVNLPSDKIPLSSDEKDVLEWLYPPTTQNVENQIVNKEKVVTTEKPIEQKVILQTQTKMSLMPLLLMIGLIFLFTFRPIDVFLQNKIPSLFQNSLTNSLVKTILFIGILLLVQFVMYLLRKNKMK
jgi:hypothetical protein